MPNDLQRLHTEWTTARPFVITFRTCAENKVRAAQEFVAFPKRDEK